MMRKAEKVSVELDSEIVAAAAAAGLNLSDVLHAALRRSLPEVRGDQHVSANQKWRDENRESIEAVNKLIEEHGLFSDGARMF